MNNYRSVYRLEIAHGYFEQEACRAMRLSVSPSGLDLMKQRGMMFRQTAINAWTVICSREIKSVDILTLEMHICDPAFVLYTDWEGFRPSSVYQAALPLTTGDATAAIRKTEEKRRINSGFCSVELQFAEEMFHTPLEDVLTFRPKEVIWEYLFISRNGEEGSKQELLLKEADDKIRFSAPERIELYGTKAWRFLSEEKIPMRERYDLRICLQEIVSGRSQVPKILLRNVPHPVPGDFVSGQAGMIRQICYF